MAVFVELDDDDVELPQQGDKPIWEGLLPSRLAPSNGTDTDPSQDEGQDREAHDAAVAEHPDINRNPITEALGCYP
jgi:hypothetical protein